LSSIDSHFLVLSNSPLCDLSYALFLPLSSSLHPTLKILPRKWSRWILKKLYSSVGGEEKKKRMLEKMKVQDRLNGAREGIYKNVPFASAGVRTDYDLDQDKQIGRGGIGFLR